MPLCSSAFTRTLLFSLVGVFAWALPCEAQDKKVYDWVFERGRLVTFRATTQSSSTTTLGGKTVGDIHHEVIATYLHRTRTLSEDGLADLELGPIKMKVRVRYGHATARWDSEDKRLRKARSLPYLKPYAEEYDRRVLFVMDVPGRRVTKIRVVPQNGAKAVAQPASMKLVGETLESGRRFFPTVPIEEGDGWPHTFSVVVSTAQKLVYTGTRTFVGFEDYKNRRCIRVTASLKGTLKTLNPEAPNTYTKASAEEKEITLFELGRGLIVYEKRSGSVKLTRTLNVKDRGDVIEVETRKSESTTDVLSVTFEDK